MNFYENVLNFFKNLGPQPQGMEYATVNTFNAVNIPYGDYMLPSNSINRQGPPGAGTFGVNQHNSARGQYIQPFSVTGPQNTQAVKDLNTFFLNNEQNPPGAPNYSYAETFSNTSLQQPQMGTKYDISENKIYTNTSNNIINNAGNVPDKNYYVRAAGESLHQKPDLLMSVFFSDDNINHLRNSVVQRVKQITADSGVAGDSEGVTIQTPNMSDFFYYMVNIFQNYKIHNGSICFVNLKNNSDLKSDISKLNTNVLQEYVSSMVSQINMYIYYYKDASQLPDQLSLPTYTSMKGSRVLEYNSAGFEPSNSIGIASYNEVGNVI